MKVEDDLRAQWLLLRERLQAKQLLEGPGASLSLRIPGSAFMWWGEAAAAQPLRVPLNAAPEGAAHAAAYLARSDAGAIALGGGAFGRCVADFGGSLLQVFDEQARHLGPMGQPAQEPQGLAQALAGGGSVALLQGRPLCLGMTATRLALNAELFEKCAKACVLAVATGGRVKPLPWIVRWVANGRLAKDRQRATLRFAQGLLPEEAKGY